MAGFELGDPVDKNTQVNRMAPPVVLRVQPDSFVRIDSPEALRSWEKAVRATTGLEVNSSNLIGTASESCSAGCTDDCDIA
jgi:hypothetical protein